MNLAGVRRRTKRRRARFTREARRFTDECGSINATELKRLVRLDAMALGAAFHLLISKQRAVDKCFAACTMRPAGSLKINTWMIGSLCFKSSRRKSVFRSWKPNANYHA
jgi:hypothetical protein